MPVAWTERELATLALVATTVVPGDDGVRRAGLMAEALSAAADPAQVARLRLALRSLESRAAGVALGLGPRPFSARTTADRERVLASWRDSRVPLRRSAFASLRGLAAFLAYGDPGDVAGGTPNPRLAAIGYVPDRAPITAAVTPARPLRVERGDEPLVLDADVVIVGSGAGGGVVAAELAAAGRSVVILEAGPFVDETSMPSDELAAFDRLYLAHGLSTTWDAAITMLAGGAVGGGTLVNWMTCIAAPAAIRDAWARDHGIDELGETEAWGMDIAAIETEMAVTPTDPTPPKDAAILRGAAALGWEAAPIRRNGAACDACGSCPFGCRQGTKQSGIRVHLARAVAHGARLIADAPVDGVVLEGGRATGVQGTVRATDGRPRRLSVRAPQVVVAGGALRTPAVLQRSCLSHPAIGQHLRIHPVSVIAGLFEEPVEMWRGPMQAARSLQFGTATAEHEPYVIESAPGHPGLIAQAMPWVSAADHGRLMAAARHIGPLIAVTRDGGRGRTRLTRAGGVRVDYALDARGVATLRHALGSMAELARAAGAHEVLAVGSRPATIDLRADPGAAAWTAYRQRLAAFDFAPNRGTVLSAHQMGTARMGADPRDHVTDPRGRVRRGPRGDAVVPGLYVADGSLFPTGLGVNPMLTVMALARRVARTVLAEG